MIELKPNHYYIGLWFFNLPVKNSKYGQGGDYMACAWRDNSTNEWRIDYRFRYYRDDKIVGSQDEMSWYAVEAGGKTEAEVESMMDEIAKRVSHAAGTVADFFPVKGDHVTFGRKIHDSPPDWLHVETQTIKRPDGQA